MLRHGLQELHCAEASLSQTPSVLRRQKDPLMGLPKKGLDFELSSRGSKVKHPLPTKADLDRHDATTTFHSVRNCILRHCAFSIPLPFRSHILSLSDFPVQRASLRPKIDAKNVH